MVLPFGGSLASAGKGLRASSSDTSNVREVLKKHAVEGEEILDGRHISVMYMEKTSGESENTLQTKQWFLPRRSRRELEQLIDSFHAVEEQSRKSRNVEILLHRTLFRVWENIPLLFRVGAGR